MKFILFIITIILFKLAFSQEFSPSRLSTEKEAQKLFKFLNKRFKKGSECYNRAHYWSYQMSKNADVNSVKVFIFLTTKYQREFSSQWWFHVAPGVYVGDELYVLDPAFLTKAVKFDAWKNGAVDHALLKLSNLKKNIGLERALFADEIAVGDVYYKRMNYINSRLEFLSSIEEQYDLLSYKMIPTTEDNFAFDHYTIPISFNADKMVDIKCPIVKTYSEYEQAQENELCYIMISSMYYRQPLDLENLESNNEQKTDWELVQFSFSKAFRGFF